MVRVEVEVEEPLDGPAEALPELEGPAGEAEVLTVWVAVTVSVLVRV